MKIVIVLVALVATVSCKSVTLVKGGIERSESKESSRGGSSNNVTSNSTGSTGVGNDKDKDNGVRDHGKGEGKDGHGQGKGNGKWKVLNLEQINLPL